MSVPSTIQKTHDGCGGTVVFRPATKRRALLAGDTVQLQAACRSCGETLSITWSLPGEDTWTSSVDGANPVAVDTHTDRRPTTDERPADLGKRRVARARREQREQEIAQAAELPLAAGAETQWFDPEQFPALARAHRSAIETFEAIDAEVRADAESDVDEALSWHARQPVEEPAELELPTQLTTRRSRVVRGFGATPQTASKAANDEIDAFLDRFAARVDRARRKLQDVQTNLHTSAAAPIELPTFAAEPTPQVVVAPPAPIIVDEAPAPEAVLEPEAAIVEAPIEPEQVAALPVTLAEAALPESAASEEVPANELVAVEVASDPLPDVALAEPAVIVPVPQPAPEIEAPQAVAPSAPELPAPVVALPRVELAPPAPVPLPVPVASYPTPLHERVTLASTNDDVFGIAIEPEMADAQPDVADLWDAPSDATADAAADAPSFAYGDEDAEPLAGTFAALAGGDADGFDWSDDASEHHDDAVAVAVPAVAPRPSQDRKRAKARAKARKARTRRQRSTATRSPKRAKLSRQVHSGGAAVAAPRVRVRMGLPEVAIVVILAAVAGIAFMKLVNAPAPRALVSAPPSATGSGGGALSDKSSEAASSASSGDTAADTAAAAANAAANAAAAAPNSSATQDPAASADTAAAGASLDSSPQSTTPSDKA